MDNQKTMPEKNWQQLVQIMKNLQLDDAPAGGSLVVYHQNKCVLDTSVGMAQKNREWRANTLSINFSTGKGVLATLVHVLVSNELLNYDTPICDYWAEFASNGKGDITLRQVLSHQANLFALNQVVSSYKDLLDWQNMLNKVATMQPFAPVNQTNNKPYVTAYSALISGWIIGGLIEKVTNLSLQQALEKYLTKPLGIADEVFFQLPQTHIGDVAQMVRNFDINAEDKPKRRIKPTLKPDSVKTMQTYAKLPSYKIWQQILGKAHSDTAITTAEINRIYFSPADLNIKNYTMSLLPNAKENLDYYQPEVMQAVIPAANCVASAAALAKIYAMLANKGSWMGIQLINESTFDEITKIQVSGQDAVMPADMQWRLGYHRVFNAFDRVGQLDQSFGHIGYNGSVAWCNPNNGLAVAYVHNYDTTLLNDIRAFAITEAVIDYLA